jgi:RNA methyltransferase, TrmH family
MHDEQHITSRQNERVKAAAKLRSARQRAKQGRFLIDGARQVTRAVAAGIEIVEGYLCPSLLDSPERSVAAESLRQAAGTCSTVTAEVYAKLAFGELEDGVVAVAHTPQRDLSQLTLPSRPLVAVLEGLEKPGNVGAILRTADGAGLDAVIIADGRTDLFNPNTIRASLGAVFATNVCAATVEETLTLLRALRVPLVATRPDAERIYTEIDFRDGAAIVLGSEAAGLSPAWQGKSVTAVRLPMRGLADSLHVSATAAVLFYEAQRQRGG